MPTEFPSSQHLQLSLYAVQLGASSWAHTVLRAWLFSTIPWGLGHPQAAPGDGTRLAVCVNKASPEASIVLFYTCSPSHPM